MDKVSVIGFTGSGKTSYLVGMYHKMSFGIGKFSLVETNDDNEYSLTTLWKEMRQGRWPVPSDQKSVYTFSLQRSFETVRKFQWLDYPGGALVDPGYNLKKDLEDELSKSACLFVLINGESFAYEGDPKDEKRIKASSHDDYKRIVTDNLENNQDKQAIRNLSQLGAAGIKIPPIAIVVTKCDLIEQNWEPYILEIIHENFQPIFAEGEKENRIVMVEAVTMGYGIEQGRPIAPDGVQYPIAFAVLSILCSRIRNTRHLIEKKEKELRAKDNVLGRIFTPGLLDELKRDIDALENDKSKTTLDAISLLDLFTDTKPIYVNGKEQKFKEYFRSVLNPQEAERSSQK